MNRLVERDEREAGMDLVADRLAYLVLSYGLLVVVAYRGLVAHETSWDLLALVVGGGFTGIAYRAWTRSLSRRWALAVGITIGIAMVVAAVFALLYRG